MSSYAQDSLVSHNHFRSLHGSPPLTLNQALIDKSQEHANFMLSKNVFQHSKTKYGENLFYAMSTDPKAEHKAMTAVQSWYDEIKYYDFRLRQGNVCVFCGVAIFLFVFRKAKNDINKTGHFTQLLWKDTKEMGAAVATKNGKWYVVATYNPPGNVVGEFGKNVLPANSK